MSKRLLRLSHHLLVVALFLGFGGHWVVLQTLAWGRMVADYSHESALGEAVQKTFDGQHPCAWCREIQKARGSEKKHDLQTMLKKVELFQEQAAPFRAASRSFWEWSMEDVASEARNLEPRVLPPRAV